MKAHREHVLIWSVCLCGQISFAQDNFGSSFVEVPSIHSTLALHSESLKGTIARISSTKTIHSAHGKQLCDGVYAFHEPEEQVDVEIVFIHGLEFDGSKEAYWKTWLARDGTQDNCWPKTWLAEEFSRARILSLSYDANVVQTSTLGRMDPYSLGESLVQEMIFGRIGQHECPVVLVCHSFGGLVAKQIVVTASQNLQHDKERENLLRNLRAFHFYATPHSGVQVDFSVLNPSTSKGSYMSYLDVFCLEVGRLNSEFEQIRREVYNSDWLCYNVAEMHATLHGRVVVPESSARQVGGRFLLLNVGHFDICRPQSKIDSSYQSLTNCISKVIKVHEDKHHLLDLPNGLVGTDYMRSTICEMLDTASIIGVVGMGGIGKTTICKVVYNLQAKFFDKTCFLQDVRSKDLAFVQKELLEGLLDIPSGNTSLVSLDQVLRIKPYIMGRRVLIVIDDVGDSETLKGLQVLAFQRNLSNGSRVIVTCRNRQVLDDHVVKEGLKDVQIMDMKFLSNARAVELFRYHVFHGVEDEEDEMKDFQGLVVDIAKACCGLPLSLEVIGQHLRKQHGHSIGIRIEIWNEALRKLHEAKSFGGGDENEVLWKRLKISYDDLSNDMKSMFLDFACFFCEISSEDLSERSIGWIWSSPIGLENLLARSLIKVHGLGKREHSFTMHDQLRDIGRRIVKDLSLKGWQVSSKYMSRLWEANEIERFLEVNQGSKVIEGISLRKCLTLAALQSQGDTSLNQEMTIHSFHSLRLLNLYECGFEVVEFFLRKCGKKLSWLCLHKVYGMVMPQAIEAIGSYIGLRVLQIRDCHFIELPTSIGNLVHLLELDLSMCKRLQSLPCEIGHLKQLKRLQLQQCKKLKGIPWGVSLLTNLEYLGLRLCINLVSMVEFETQMDHLYELNLGFCLRLRIPLKSLGKLHQLRILDMKGCGSIVIEDPCESFGQLSRLEKLNLVYCENLILGLCCGNSVGEFTSEKIERLWDPIMKNLSFRLQELHLNAISQVGLPTYPKLKVLELHNEFHLEELPASLGDFTQLERLTVVDVCCGYFRRLPDSFCSLVKLQEIELFNHCVLDKLPNKLGLLCSLKTLTIDGMSKLEELPTTLGQLSQLKCLSVKRCESLKCFPQSFTSLTQLSKLSFTGCDALDVTNIHEEFILQELVYRGCEVNRD